MKKEELPDWIRVKMPEEQTEELWEEIESVKEFSEDLDYSAQQLYNWKNKNCFLPVDLVREVLESVEIVAMKGRNNSKPVENPGFPLKFSDELLTRVDSSVSVNREGTPVYRTQEVSLLKRFKQLLETLGEVPHSVYRHSGYELRYPKFLHELMILEDYHEDFSARFDEEGTFEGEMMVAGSLSQKVEVFDDELFSRSKRYELALKQQDSGKLEEMVAQQVNMVRKSGLELED